MNRKLIAFVLAFAMLASLSLAVVADEMSAYPTVEEILNEYHRKAFEEQTQGDTDNGSAWSRRGGDVKTLEQETVDTLTDAGYEAYNVTTDNYENLEAELKTDFTDMGLDYDGSYIVVISGEEPTEPGQSTYGFPPNTEEDQAPDGGGSTFFTHTYNGQTYYMRYVTITAATNSDMYVPSNYILAPSVWAENMFMNIVNTALVAVADCGSSLPLGTIGSLLSFVAVDDNYTELEPGSLTVIASTTWTCSAIQVWDSNFERWETAQCSAYADSRAYCTGYIYDPLRNLATIYYGKEFTRQTYSPKYNASLQRKNEAAEANNGGRIAYDRTGDINFYLGNETGTILYEIGGGPLFSHVEGWGVPMY